MTGDEFRETCEWAIRKYRMKKKIVLLSIAAWIVMIAGIEIIVWWPANWISIPVIATCIIAFIVLVVSVISTLVALSEEIAEKKKEERKAKGY